MISFASLNTREDLLVPNRKVISVPLEADLQIVVLGDELQDCFRMHEQLVSLAQEPWN